MSPKVGDRVRVMPSTRTPEILHGKDLIVVAVSERRSYTTVQLAEDKSAGQWPVPARDLSPAERGTA